MKTIILISVLLFQINLAQAQEKKQKLRIYKIWAYTTDGEKIKGILHEAREDGIVVYERIDKQDYQPVLIEASRISHLKLRRKGDVGRSTAIGFAAGSAAGALMGYSLGDDDQDSWFVPDKKDSALVGATVFGLIGAGSGAVIGSKKKRVYINGDTKLYLTHLNSLVNYDQVPEY